MHVPLKAAISLTGNITKLYFASITVTHGKNPRRGNNDIRLAIFNVSEFFIFPLALKTITVQKIDTTDMLKLTAGYAWNFHTFDNDTAVFGPYVPRKVQANIFLPNPTVFDIKIISADEAKKLSITYTLDLV